MGTRLVIDQLQREAAQHHMEAVRLINHLAQAKREIDMLRDEVMRLQARINELELGSMLPARFQCRTCMTEWQEVAPNCPSCRSSDVHRQGGENG